MIRTAAATAFQTPFLAARIATPRACAPVTQAIAHSWAGATTAAPARVCRMNMLSARQASSVAAGKARPLSPHLTIYKFQTNMISSVVFRGTGLFLMGGLSLLSIAYIPLSGSVSSYVYLLQQYAPLLALVKAGIAFPLSYHLLGGLRHMAWDNVIGHNAAWVNKTGNGALAAACVIGVVAAFTEFQ